MRPESGKFVEGVLSVGCRFNRVAPQRDHARQRRALTLFIVHDQDASRSVVCFDHLLFSIVTGRKNPIYRRLETLSMFRRESNSKGPMFVKQWPRAIPGKLLRVREG